jgi:serine/threonine-protein kinase HipA
VLATSARACRLCYAKHANEEFGSRFARAAGLTPFPTWIGEFEGVPALVIERYDRSPDAPQGRIHQEDFNQVLGAAGNQKYQEYGSTASARITHGHLSVRAVTRRGWRCPPG